jgi:hypothetical protein
VTCCPGWNRMIMMDDHGRFLLGIEMIYALGEIC